ncbi:type II toxin-antitoxin system VapB family antitoxin [Mycobacterium hubeiense]|uniref:type II toxin-antitoxin system VapB family antitoxin n=1 Tax=Mycobacterium hubeiense TaxID=1867256 RepID=UPI000C7F2D3E|nr:type II toxin-antitoxin system VapB family antitoxin [Mycobacterium sp. QGD 101]
MALNIKDDEADRLARELAQATGETITVATRTALAERLARVRRSARQADAADIVHDIIERGRRRPTLDDRSEAEILGYDERGLPG